MSDILSIMFYSASSLLIFLYNDLGKGNGRSTQSVRFSNEYKNTKNNTRTIVYSWNMPAVATIKGLLLRVLYFLYKINRFFNFDIDK